MVTPLNTTGTINTGTGAAATNPQAFYDKLLLELLVQTEFHHAKFAQERDLPKHGGNTVNFRKIVALKPELTPLTEGVTPEGLTASLEAITVSTKQYGDWLAFTDMVDVTQLDPIIKEYTVELARMAREKLDLITRDELNAGTNAFFANSKTSRITLAAGDKPTVDDFRRIVLGMKTRHVKPASGDRYVAFITPEVAFDLIDDPKFLKAYEIAQNGTPFIKGEIADVYGVKFVELVNAKVFEGEGAAGIDIHSSLVIGRKPYGVTKIKGEGVKTIIKPLGSAGTEDPLDQRQSIGYKINAYAVKRLYEEAIVRYESVPSNA